MTAFQARAPLGAVAVAVLTLAAGESRAQWGPNGLNFPNSSEVALIQTLQSSPDPGQRQRAARRLIQIGTDRAIPALASAAAYDTDRETRITSGDAIAAIRQR